MKNIKVIVATHKKFEMPEDSMYIPLFVGSENKNDIGYQKDNEGENISIKNPYYCELTGLYWAWKNLKCDYIGLVHYRRHFSMCPKILKSEHHRIESTLTFKEADKILENVDVILPKKRRYYIENLYNHYKNTTYVEPLDETRKILDEKCPQYLKEYDKMHTRTSAHMFNMFIMKKEILDNYCMWLFDILSELEKRVPPEKYDSFHARYLGRISELLLDIWIETNDIKYKEVSVIDIQNINWLKKGIAFLQAKFAKKKYGKSF